MPRLNTLGSALMGVGGGGITSIDGTPVPQLVGAESGDWDWLTTTTITGKAKFPPFPPNVYALWSIALPAGAPVQIGTGESTFWASGGGVWTGASTTFPGVKSNVSALVQPLASVGDVSETGQSVLVVNFAADLNLNVYSNVGVLLHQISIQIAPINCIRLRQGVLSYPDVGFNWHLMDVSTGNTLPFAARVTRQTWMVPVVVGAKVYVLERDITTPAEMITIREATQPTGFVIDNTILRYNPDIVPLTGSTVRIAYSTGQGELPAELVMHDVDLVSGAHTKATIVAGAPVWVVQPTLTPTPLPTFGGVAPGQPPQGAATLRAAIGGLYNQSVTDRANGRMTVPWYRFNQELVNFVSSPINLGSGQVAGILPAAQGGTGGTTGISQIGPSTVQLSQQSVLLGRGAGAGGGLGQEITLGAGLTMTGTELDAAGAGGITELTGDVTAGPGSGSEVATIPNDTVTYAKMQNVSAASRLLGRGSASGSGDVQEITVGSGLTMSGTTLTAAAPGTGAVVTARLVLTDAQIKVLNTTPFTLVAAPGAGFVNVLLHMATCQGFTTGYTEAADWICRYATEIVDLTPTIAFSSQQTSYYTTRAGIGTTFALTDAENRALVLFTTTDFTGGNSANTLTVSVTYYIQAV